MTVALSPAPPRLRRSSFASRLSGAQTSPLCFHNLTNCFSRNPCALITMQIARGCTPSEISNLRFAISKLSVNSVHSLRPLCLTPFLSNFCALFGTLLPSKINPSSLFSIASALFCKHRGRGPSRRNISSPCFARRRRSGLCLQPTDNLVDGGASRAYRLAQFEVCQGAIPIESAGDPGY